MIQWTPHMRGLRIDSLHSGSDSFMAVLCTALNNNDGMHNLMLGIRQGSVEFPNEGHPL